MAKRKTEAEKAILQLVTEQRLAAVAHAQTYERLRSADAPLRSGEGTAMALNHDLDRFPEGVACLPSGVGGAAAAGATASGRAMSGFFASADAGELAVAGVVGDQLRVAGAAVVPVATSHRLTAERELSMASSTAECGRWRRWRWCRCM